MATRHGIIILEQPTSIVAPVQADSAVQVAVGVSPINLGEAGDPLSLKTAYTYDEAVKKLGYSRDLERYPLCQVIKASFELYGVCPVVFINVLDPARHTVTVTDRELVPSGGRGELREEGILLETLTVSRGGEALTPGTDYTAGFNSDGTVSLELTAGAGTEAVTVSYRKLDPSMVKKEDILAGIRKIAEVYPKLNLVPGLLLCPGWAHMPEIYTALTARTENLNQMFRCMALCDLDPEESPSYDDCNAVKNENGMNGAHSVLCWPKVRVGDNACWMSALLGAHIAYTDHKNDDVPYVSPSNKAMKIAGICGGDGEEIVLDMGAANLLNSQGICTAINLNGWRFWGNYTAAYPGISDVKDVFIPVRRMFSWWGNTFLLTYFQKVDDPMNSRLIEAVVDSENIRANGFKARLQLADAHIEYRAQDNPKTDLLGGTIRFHQYLTPFPPAQALVNTLEFSPDALSEALT